MAGNIYHSWVGTVLTITSDSGTSSSDLKGAKGDDGPRGAQGAPGSTIAEDCQKLGGVAAAQYALKNNVPAYNLLDNSDFRNPVNQRGKNTYSDGGNEYTIDRWKTQYDTNISIENGYINIFGNWDLYQRIKNPKDGIYTFAARIRINSVGQNQPNIYINDGSGSSKECLLDASPGEWKTYIFQHDLSSTTGEAIRFSLSPRGGNTTASISVEWVAMYKGSYDASTLPAYQPKGYAAELAECQRYYLPLNNQLLGSGYTFYGGAALLVPRKMRIDSPSFVASGAITARVNGADYPLTLSSITTYGSMIKVDFTNNTIPILYPCAFYSDASGVSLNADL